jgi:hypothetical protein
MGFSGPVLYAAENRVRSLPFKAEEERYTAELVETPTWYTFPYEH